MNQIASFAFTRALHKASHFFIMKAATNSHGKKALLIEAQGGTCAIAEGISKEDLLALREELGAANADFAKRHGMTMAQFDRLSNDELWELGKSS